MKGLSDKPIWTQVTNLEVNDLIGKPRVERQTIRPDCGTKKKRSDLGDKLKSGVKTTGRQGRSANEFQPGGI